MKYRKSISGIKMRESDRTKITINTLCPSKWVIVDTESGHVYSKKCHDGPWVMPTLSRLKDAREVLTRAIKYQEE
jgi:hypothetical protein